MTQNDANFAKIKVLIDGEMTIALKLFDLILKQAKDGDQNASKIVSEKTLNVLDLITTGAAIREAQKDNKGEKIDLGTVADDLVLSTKTLGEFLPELSSEAFAKIISEANQNTIFASTNVGNPDAFIISQMGVLILQKKLEEQSGGKKPSEQNPGFKAVKKLAESHSEVLAAYIASQDVALNQVQSYAKTGEISQEAEDEFVTKKAENIKKFEADPASIEKVQPPSISDDVYQQYVTTTVANQNAANTSSTSTTDPTETLSPKTTTSTPTTNTTTNTTSATTTPTTTSTPTTTTIPPSSMAPPEEP